MATRHANLYTMEALTLVSFFCIVAIFLVARYDLAVAEMDGMALRTGKEVKVLAPEIFGQNPEEKLSVEKLKQAGLKVPAGVELEVPIDFRLADDWQVKLWHEKGNTEYLVNAKGIDNRPR